MNNYRRITGIYWDLTDDGDLLPFGRGWTACHGTEIIDRGESVLEIIPPFDQAFEWGKSADYAVTVSLKRGQVTLLKFWVPRSQMQCEPFIKSETVAA